MYYFAKSWVLEYSDVCRCWLGLFACAVSHRCRHLSSTAGKCGLFRIPPFSGLPGQPIRGESLCATDHVELFVDSAFRHPAGHWRVLHSRPTAFTILSHLTLPLLLLLCPALFRRRGPQAHNGTWEQEKGGDTVISPQEHTELHNLSGYYPNTGFPNFTGSASWLLQSISLQYLYVC